MKHIKKILITTLTFLSLESYAGWFSPEIVICDSSNQVQKRGGVIYLPNQSDGFTGLNSCIWTKNEQQSSLGDYSNGLKDGKWTKWHENGQKSSEGSYENGRKYGEWTEWKYKGHKKSEGSYKEGKKDGEWTMWHERYPGPFEGTDTREWNIWSAIGQKSSEGTYKDGKKDGEWTQWPYISIDGNTTSAPVLTRRTTTWFSNGQKKK